MNDTNSFIKAKNVISSGLDMHHLVNELTQKITKTYGFTMHASVTVYLLDIIVLITIQDGLIKRNVCFLVISNVTYTLFSTAVFVVSEKLNFEKIKIKLLLTELSLPYLDEELSDLRQRFYYRLFYEKDEISAGGFYNINVKTITTVSDEVNEDSIFNNDF
ncbi:hypothetical protein RN001_007537 [Aquatica leii]|uniref:Uncharacterized protein n=1 Tax=Aquatica leii TaxID=1421715 RepID=A0AAN7S956_9COLE|nr:hypothetical protein RN001_007537 [Aquatica leii]